MTPKPSLVERVQNAADAATRVIAAVATGDSVLVSDDRRQARLRVCLYCPAFDEILGECAVCGCYVPVKARLATERCPSNKWPGDTLPEA